MDARFYSHEVGYLAIPLKANPNHSMGSAQPNWLIIESMGGRSVVDLPQPLGPTVCQLSLYSIVHRQLLPESIELGRKEEMTDFVYERANQAIPVWAVPALSDYNILAEPTKMAEINFLLSMFQFRGKLAGFVLEVDTVVLDEIIQDMA